MHLRLAPRQAALIRHAARAAGMEISAYVWHALDEYWTGQVTEDGEKAGTSGGGNVG